MIRWFKSLFVSRQYYEVAELNYLVSDCTYFKVSRRRKYCLVHTTLFTTDIITVKFDGLSISINVDYPYDNGMFPIATLRRSNCLVKHMNTEDRLKVAKFILELVSPPVIKK